MKDMRHIYSNTTFQETVTKFQAKLKTTNESPWSVFKSVFLVLTQYKCPICEVSVDIYDDIDHYRPKDTSLYPFLKYDHDNYMVMCSRCNRKDKKIKFPLDTSFKASVKTHIHMEFPLLTNPCNDDIYELFELEFCTKKGKNLLLLRPKSDLDPSSYKYRKATETIKMYNLDNIEDEARLKLFQIHHDALSRFVKTYNAYLLDSSEENKIAVLAVLNDEQSLVDYGFYHFIQKKQFIINTPLISA